MRAALDVLISFNPLYRGLALVLRGHRPVPVVSTETKVGVAD
jgi:hypothetical protein